MIILESSVVMITPGFSNALFKRILHTRRAGRLSLL
jgi:hypothetical protein